MLLAPSSLNADGQVSEGGHGLGAVAGPDLGGVFGVGDVADVVQGFDLPVAADPGGELGGVSLAGGQAGDGVDGDSAPFLLAGQGLDPAGNAISSSSAHGQPRRLPLTFSTNALVSIRHPGQTFSKLSASQSVEPHETGPAARIARFLCR
jgi:hypothetical protein